MTYEQVIAIVCNTKLTIEHQAEASFLSRVYSAVSLPRAREGFDPATIAACLKEHAGAQKPLEDVRWHRGRLDAIARGWPGRPGVGVTMALVYAVNEAVELIEDDSVRLACDLAIRWFQGQQAN